MMRVVLDTNIVVSGSLWSGTPSKILQFIQDQKIQPIITEAIIDELQDVL